MYINIHCIYFTIPIYYIMYKVNVSIQQNQRRNNQLIVLLTTD